MKKNRMMRAASLLLVAVLLTTCTISGTFAKYTTSGSATDTARVAKWGVNVVASAVTADTGMFAKVYAKDDSVGTFTNSVESDVKVVAPGTGVDNAATFTITGTPEVAVKVTYDATIDLGNNWIDAADMSKFYCPLVFTINGTPVSGLDYTSASDFITAIEGKIEGTEYFAPGTNLATNSDLEIDWTWAFEGATGSKNNQDNVKDTFLGNRAAGDVGNAGTVSISVTCTVDQVN